MTFKKLNTRRAIPKEEIRAAIRQWLEHLMPYRVNASVEKQVRHALCVPIEGWGRVGRQVWNRVHRQSLGICYSVYDRIFKQVLTVSHHHAQSRVHKNVRSYGANMLGVQILFLLDPIRATICDQAKER